jgi:hypothetical protein
MGIPKRLSFIKRPKAIVPLVIIGLLALAVVMAVKNLNAPAEGTISQTPASQAEKIAPYSQPGAYKGRYVSFTYPAHYKISPSKLSGSYLEVASLGAADISGKRITVGVYRGNLKDDGNVSFRRKYPNLYHETSSKIGLEFRRTDSTEDTFFISHNGMIASVSATTPGASQDNDALFVASSLQWK